MAKTLKIIIIIIIILPLEKASSCLPLSKPWPWPFPSSKTPNSAPTAVINPPFPLALTSPAPPPRETFPPKPPRPFRRGCRRRRPAGAAIVAVVVAEVATVIIAPVVAAADAARLKSVLKTWPLYRKWCRRTAGLISTRDRPRCILLKTRWMTSTPSLCSTTTTNPNTRHERVAPSLNTHLYSKTRKTISKDERGGNEGGWRWEKPEDLARR